MTLLLVEALLVFLEVIQNKDLILMMFFYKDSLDWIHTSFSKVKIQKEVKDIIEES